MLKVPTNRYPNADSITCPLCMRLVEAMPVCHDWVCRCGSTLTFVDYRPVHDPDELSAWLNQRGRSVMSFDFETTGLDPFRGEIVGMSFASCDEPGVAIYVPVRHRLGDCMDPDRMKAIVAPFLATHPIAAHNAGFEFKWCSVHLGIEPIIDTDTMIESWMDDLNRASRFDGRSIALKSMAVEVLKLKTVELDQLIDLKQMDFSFVPVRQAYRYGCQDADLVVRLRRLFHDRLVLPVEEGGQGAVHLMEHNLIAITARMELRGVQIDLDGLAAAGPVLQAELETVQAEIDELAIQHVDTRSPVHELASRHVDVQSPVQVADFLFRRMGVPIDDEFVGKPAKGWPDGMPSTSKKALDLIREHYRPVDLIMTAREIAYAIDNYVEKLPGKVRPETSTLHGHMNQTGTPTGRYSSNDPNLQSIAKVRD